MGAELAERYPALLGSYYGQAGDILDLPIAQLCWTGPAQALRDTSITQPAVFLTSICAARVLAQHDVVPTVVAGHSLGEYTAYVVAGILDWTDALRLVQLRGQLMAAVNERVPGSMAAVIGMNLNAVEECCLQAEDTTGQIVDIANDNEPEQVVISGGEAGVARASALAQAAGARRVVKLQVGAPFHCRLMGDMEQQFAQALAEVRFHDPTTPVVSSVSADLLRTGGQARELLAVQLTARVRWLETIRRISRMGTQRYVEVGSGTVLSGLIRRIDPDATTFSTQSASQLLTLLDALNASR